MLITGTCRHSPPAAWTAATTSPSCPIGRVTSTSRPLRGPGRVAAATPSKTTAGDRHPCRSKSATHAASVLVPIRWSGHEQRLTTVTGVLAGLPTAIRSCDHRAT